jgi:type II secretory pathway component PulF
MRAIKPTPLESLASVARQLQYALEQSATIDEAFQKLHAAGDQRQQTTLRQLESLLRSPGSDAAMSRSMRLTSYPMLAWLLRQTASPEKSASALFREYQHHESFSATAVVAVWSEFAGFLAYLGAVLAVLIVVVSMYGLFVLPEFRMLYGGFSGDLPVLTRVAFGGGLFMLLVLVAAGFLGFLSWFVHLLRRQLRRYVPLSAGYQKIPLSGGRLPPVPLVVVCRPASDGRHAGHRGLAIGGHAGTCV